MANRYLVGAGGNWNSTGVWSDTDGGAGGFSFPINGDAVFLTAASGSVNLTVNVTSACTSFNCTGFTGTLTRTAVLAVNGSVTLSASMTVSGTAQVQANSGGTHTSNGLVWPGTFVFSGGTAHTLADAWSVVTLQTGLGTGTGTIINGNSITISGTLVLTHTLTSSTTGTTELIMAGTGSVSWNGNTGTFLQNNLTINTTGTITFPNVVYGYGTGILKYVAGTVVTGTGTLAISLGATTLNTDGIEWYRVSMTVNATVTLQSNLTVNNLLTIGSLTNNTTINGAFEIIAKGAVNFSNTTGNVAGAATVKLVAPVSQTVAKTAGAGQMILGIIIDSPGTVTFTGALYASMTNFKCISGTVITPKGTWTAFGGGSPVQKSFASIG